MRLGNLQALKLITRAEKKELTQDIDRPKGILADDKESKTNNRGRNKIHES